jgi:protein TonB
LLTGYDNRPGWRSRVSAALLSLGIMALIVLALLQLGRLAANRDLPGNRLTAVPLSDAAASDQKKAAKRAEARPKQAVVALPQPVPTPAPTPPPFKIIRLSREEFAASDISGLTRHPAESADNGDAGQDSGAAYGPGAGPGGARLFRAEWYREPSNAEIGGYLKAGAPPGSWAMIACQTIDRYHVDNCRELDESPRGSGLARAMRQAAWQFLVRPPRLGGKPIPGAWVSIRITFSKKPVSEEAVLPGVDG